MLIDSRAGVKGEGASVSRVTKLVSMSFPFVIFRFSAFKCRIFPNRKPLLSRAVLYPDPLFLMRKVKPKKPGSRSFQIRI